MAITVGDFEQAIELFHARGWTDGLPVIPPTPERLARFLAYTGRDADEQIGFYELRARPVTVEKVAINAIMAGCLPEHLPVVLAIVEGLLDPKVSLHVANSSTGSLTIGFIVNGPVRRQLGMNCDGNVLGPGNRANASIGRAVRLVQLNVMGTVGGAGAELSHRREVLDRSTIGHPAKYTAYHIVENEELFPQLEPLHVGLGFAPEQSVVTSFAMGNHVMMSNHFEKTPDAWIDTVVHYMIGAGRLAPAGFGVLLIPPEAAAMFVAEGWSKRDISAALFERSRRTVAWVKQNGYKVGGRYERGGAVQPGDEEKWLGMATSADDIHVVICGGPAGNFPTFLQTYAETFEVASREIRMPDAEAKAPAVYSSALAPLRDMLRTDAYDLEVVSADAAALVLQITAGEDACADCLVPPAMMETYVRNALKAVPGGETIPLELRYPAGGMIHAS